jgi:hypothetical protein
MAERQGGGGQGQNRDPSKSLWQVKSMNQIPSHHVEGIGDSALNHKERHSPADSCLAYLIQLKELQVCVCARDMLAQACKP